MSDTWKQVKLSEEAKRMGFTACFFDGVLYWYEHPELGCAVGPKTKEDEE